ncbi:sensor histidine kinase [Sulfurimonas sp. NW9]|uniref:sensor histidine kinase n=2 Tax=Sulfurimonadaceae TaxID=2771471 RepID=UPI003DA98C23
MFRNLRIIIFIYYFFTVAGFLLLGYYFINVLHVENLYMFAFIVLCIVILSGVFISKLAVDPLAEYVQELQNLSKETLHELNLPISTITTTTQLLGKNCHDEKILKRIGRINTACMMLKERYNELDYLIKMQTNQKIKEEFFVDELVKQRVGFVKKIYPQMKFNLVLEKMPVLSDQKGLGKVIDNIIDNGVKYSGTSRNIDIEVKNNSIKIKDYGIGMDEVELVRIFDNYYQSNKNMQGFGIGLNLVKRFCERNNIELLLQSSKNIGTTVELKFKQEYECK